MTLLKKKTMKESITKTEFVFTGQKDVYHGKVRDVYFIEKDYLVMIASDRISAFDHVLPKGIPFKGQVLNQVATFFLNATKDIVPNWLIGVPHPNVAVGYKCEPIRIEMVIRGYLTGHAWREYKSGKRCICGVNMPEGMVENQAFPTPIITPATKAEEGHDEDISREEILNQGIVSQEVYNQLEHYTHQLFQRGTEMAAERGLILVDTKYEFGMLNGKVVLMDEIHTPDSSRYFYKKGYSERQKNGEKQSQLSKEFVREWLIENNFQGLEGQCIPEMTDAFVEEVSNKYIELYEVITGKPFIKQTAKNIKTDVFKTTEAFLKDLIT